MILVFEICPHPGDFEAEDEILNALNDDGLRAVLEGNLALAIQSAMYWERKIYIRAKLKEWDVNHNQYSRKTGGRNASKKSCQI